MSNSLKICVDASLVMRLVLSGEKGSPIFQLWQGWFEANAILIAPSLIFYEITNALHQQFRHQLLEVEEVNRAFQTSLELGIRTVNNPQMHQRAAEIARIWKLNAAYDAHYVALAEQEQAACWTADKKLVKAVPKSVDWVHLWRPR